MIIRGLTQSNTIALRTHIQMFGCNLFCARMCCGIELREICLPPPSVVHIISRGARFTLLGTSVLPFIPSPDNGRGQLQ